MAEAIIMPKTGMAMEEGTILEWFVKEGDTVAAGDAVAEIETDKSTMELESDFGGTVIKIVHPEGTTVPVIEPVAWIGQAGEAVPESAPADMVETVSTKEQAASPVESQPVATDTNQGLRVKATPAARRAAGERRLPLEGISPSGRYGEIRERDVLEAQVSRATPLARRMAEAEGLDLSAVTGSGHGGKVFSADLKVTAAPAADAALSGSEDKRIPLTKIQQITGKRMMSSHTEIPSVTMNTAADVTALLSMRKQLNETLDCRITINDLVLKAAAAALAENPRINSVLDGNELIYKSAVNISMAVATDRGLLVPVVRNADELTIRQLSAAAADVAARGREGKLTPEDMDGGTFTVSNIGMYGINSFSPIINQPQAAILGVCAITDKLALQNGAVETVKEMGLSLTFDHRIVDGAEASVFFARIRELLEKPLALLA